MITTMFFVLVTFPKRALRIIINLARNAEKGGGVLMSVTLPNLKHSFIFPVPVPDSGFPCFPWHIVKHGVEWSGVEWICKTWSGFVKG